MSDLTHFRGGRPQMVDISQKTPTLRIAKAEAYLQLTQTAITALKENPKGDPLAVAELAGILAAKRTSEMVALCHPLLLSHVEVRCVLIEEVIRIEATVKTREATGVEMEALTAVSVAALNLYDMLKSTGHGLEITGMRVLHKSGGASGIYEAEPLKVTQTEF